MSAADLGTALGRDWADLAIKTFVPPSDAGDPVEVYSPVLNLLLTGYIQAVRHGDGREEDIAALENAARAAFEKRIRGAVTARSH